MYGAPTGRWSAPQGKSPEMVFYDQRDDFRGPASQGEEPAEDAGIVRAITFPSWDTAPEGARRGHCEPHAGHPERGRSGI
ncbi:hypothetical protein ACVNPS_08340 [Candidatus Bipolaricaulota sp. J31]